MSQALGEREVRSIAEEVVSQAVAQLRRELQEAELGRLRQTMEAWTERFGAALHQLAEAQRRTEERLNALAARVDAVAEAQRRTEERLDALAEAQRRTEERLNLLAARVDALAEAQLRTEERLAALAARVDELTGRVDRLTEQVARLAELYGQLDGRLLEMQFGEKVNSFLGGALRRVRAMRPRELEEVLEPVLSDAELDDFLHADWVVRGRLPGAPAGQEVLWVVEVSSTVDEHDVERAARRSGYLRKAGYSSRGCVLGHRITSLAMGLARQYGLAVFVDGRQEDGAHNGSEP